MNNNLDRRSVFYSVGLHLGILLFAIAGLPDWLDHKDPEPIAMSVEILPISEMSNVKNSPLPLAKKEAPPKPQPKPAKPVKETPPPPKKPEPKPEPTPEPEPKPEEKKEPIEKKEEEKPKPKEPEKEKPTPKEETPDPKKEEKDALDDILKNVRDAAQQADETDEKAKPDEAGTTMKSDKPFDPGKPLSMSERDAIVQQLVRCWNPPAGVKDDYTLRVVIKAQFNPDGTLVGQPMLAAGQGALLSTGQGRAAADSALRAVGRCAPLKNLDPSKHGSWGEMELTFDPRFLY